MATSKHAKTSRATTERQRAIQAKTEHKEQHKSKPKASSPKKATSKTAKPTNPLPKQHQRKPGSEQQLDPRPQFMAPNYAGSGKLAGMSALITGGDSGIGRAVAVLFAREGADVAIVYLSEDADAEETRDYVEGEGQRCLLVRGDVTDPEFCREAVEATVRELDQVDILVNNAAFQEHVPSLEELSD